MSGGRGGGRLGGRGKVAGRDRVLSAALALFLANGYAHVSLRRVGAAVGIRDTSVIWYFPDGKLELYAAVVMEAERRLAEALAAVRERGGSLEGRVEGIALAFLSAVPGHPAQLWADAKDAFATDSLRYDELLRRYSANVIGVAAAILQESGRLRRELDPVSVANVVIGACIAYADGSPTADMGHEAAARLIAQIVTPGITRRR